MYQEEIINIIKEKYPSKYNFVDGNILYKDRSINIFSSYRYVTFHFKTPSNISNIEINMVRRKVTKERVLSKFRSMIRLIDKVDKIIETLNSKREEIAEKVDNFTKNEYGAEIDKIKITLNKSQKPIGRYRYKNVDYDVSIKQKTFFEILVSINQNLGRDKVLLTFKYVDPNLILLRRTESYHSKNISNIIRSEKLKSLFYNE